MLRVVPARAVLPPQKLPWATKPVVAAPAASHDDDIIRAQAVAPKRRRRPGKDGAPRVAMMLRALRVLLLTVCACRGRGVGGREKEARELKQFVGHTLSSGGRPLGGSDSLGFLLPTEQGTNRQRVGPRKDVHAVV